ncbi:hypothetical protein [Lacimicrobium alkaliphilum]|uniref:Uncharacterized protein n=1 Tax=Lacimicrobium alkaliphilum TaxID=1526571 RepID=A0A0U3AQ92_9ALTE|nr:hypothetical protein [Lacimicrobium alkaliphilum]ALT00051.1 hypothetical protein AT746_18430 [Lacimicrobium alkaliphilum]
MKRSDIFTNITLALFFILTPFFSVAKQTCLNAIENKVSDMIIGSCFMPAHKDLSMREAILYEKLNHDFGTFDNPSAMYQVFENMAKSGGPDFMYRFAQSTEMAFGHSKTKWAGKPDGMINSRDVESGLYDDYDEYIKPVREKIELWYKKAAESGSRDSQVMYIKRRLNPWKDHSIEELELALSFSKQLKANNEPNIDRVIQELEILIAEKEL